MPQSDSGHGGEGDDIVDGGGADGDLCDGGTGTNTVTNCESPLAPTSEPATPQAPQAPNGGFTLTGQGRGFLSGPGVCSWAEGRLDVFGTGLDSGLWHKWWNGAAWSGWEPLGGGLTSDPAAISWGGERLDIFFRGADSSMMQYFRP